MAVSGRRTPPIRHAHSSSLYNGPVEKLAAQMRKFVKDTDPDANIITLTEVGSPARTRILKEAAPGEWGVWVPGPTDVGIMWRKRDWSLRAKDCHKLTDLTWVDGHGRRHTTYAASALFRHTDGHTLFVSVCHLPSHVQIGAKYRDNAQARAWKDAVRNWARYWAKADRGLDPDFCMIVADWNVDFRLKVWRERVGRRFSTLSLNWAGANMPPRGTHGNRVIDATWASRRPTKVRLLPHDGSSDHRPYGEGYHWRKRRRVT